MKTMIDDKELMENLGFIFNDIYNNRLKKNGSIGLTYRKRHYKIIRDE